MAVHSALNDGLLNQLTPPRANVPEFPRVPPPTNVPAFPQVPPPTRAVVEFPHAPPPVASQPPSQVPPLVTAESPPAPKRVKKGPNRVPIAVGSCEECEHSFYTTKALKEHEAAHQNGNKHLCDICGKLVTQGDNLKAHMRTHQKPSEKVWFICPKCPEIHPKTGKPGNQFASRGNLNKHMQRHDGYTTECKLCGKPLTSDLLRHMKGSDCVEVPNRPKTLARKRQVLQNPKP